LANRWFSARAVFSRALMKKGLRPRDRSEFGLGLAVFSRALMKKGLRLAKFVQCCSRQLRFPRALMKKGFAVVAAAAAL
jgi:hypothetical protein